MSDVYRKDIDDVLLEFSINGKAKNEDWCYLAFYTHLITENFFKLKEGTA